MKNKFLIVFAMMLALSPLIFVADAAFADDTKGGGTEDIVVEKDYGSRNSLTDIFRNNSMRGNDRMLARLGFIPWLTQAVVAFVGLASNAQIIIRTLVTVLYLSFRNFWDMVHEAHEEGLGAAPPSWTDKLVWAILWIMPDFKAYSDYGGRSNLNINQDDDLMQYLLKIAPKTLIVITISTMAYNGSYALMYAEVADALDTMAASSGSIKLTEKVKHIIDSGDRYKFVWEGSKDPKDRFYADLAKASYRTAVNAGDITDANIINQLGADIESKIVDTIKIKESGDTGFVSSVALGKNTVYSGGDKGAYTKPGNNNKGKFQTASQKSGLTVAEAVSQLQIKTVHRPAGYAGTHEEPQSLMFKVNIGEKGYVEVHVRVQPIEVK